MLASERRNAEIVSQARCGANTQMCVGRASSALPQITSRLARVVLWWQHWREGQPDPEAPDLEALARSYVSALDVAKQAATALEDWPAAEIANTRFNRATVLGPLRRFGAAMEELQAFFSTTPPERPRCLARLPICMTSKAISHNNLASYLARSADAQAQEQAHWHQLTALLYFLVSELGQDLQTSLGNYAIFFRHAKVNHTPLFIPRIADLLIHPGFDPLAQWLSLRAVDLEALQTVVDELLEQVRQQALAEPDEQE